MSIDLADIWMSVENALGVDLKFDDWASVFKKHHPPDISVSDLVECILSAKRVCPSCRSGLPADERALKCPNCKRGIKLIHREHVWDAVIPILEEVFGASKGSVRPQSLFVRDLGMT